MSDSETSSVTIEAIPFETIISNINQAANDLIESNDYLTYSTILDVYLSDPSRYSNEERETLLDAVLSVLDLHPKLTYEIAWDLPELLVPYFSLDYDLVGPLRSAPCSKVLFDLFDCLAKNGNSKELFLRSCELLSSLALDESDGTTQFQKDSFLGLKMYVVFELIISTMRKIETLHPSRFLSMAITSMINFLYLNRDTATNMEFFLKRIYGFARNYTSAPLPKDCELSKLEIDKIVEDENYLQRKLLSGLVTNVIFIVGKTWSPLNTVTYFNHFSKQQLGTQLNLAVIDFLKELSSTFDIDVDQEFTDLIVSSHEIFHKFDLTRTDDDLVGEIFEAVIVDYQENLLTNIVTSDLKQIGINKLGVFLYYIRTVIRLNEVEDNDFPVNVTFNDIVILTLRLMIPMVVSPVFNHNSLKDALVFWSWYAVEKLSFEGKKLNLEISSIPKVLLITYCNLLLFICTSCPSPDFKDLRFCTLTLLTKILSMAPEQTSYEFIMDNLNNSPLSNAKAAMVGILKELLCKDKASIEDDLEKLSLDKPSLPSRDVSKSTKYISLTDDRFDDILKYIQETVDNTFVEGDEKFDVDNSLLPVLSSGLNLLVGLKSNEVYKKNSDKVAELMRNFESIHEKAVTQYKGTNEGNLLSMLQITVDRINSK